MFEVISKEEREVWAKYQGLINTHKSYQCRNTYWRENRMAQWEQEYRNLDNTRRTEIKKINKERQYNEKNDKKEKEDEKTEKKENMIEKRKKSIEKNKLKIIQQVCRRSSRLKNKNTSKENHTDEEIEVANIIVSFKDNK
jgi:hypothetical protein